MLLLLLLLLLLPAGLPAQAGGDLPPQETIRLPDVILRGEETSVLLPPPPLRPPPVDVGDLTGSWARHGRSPGPPLRPEALAAPARIAFPLPDFITPESQLRIFAPDAAGGLRAPGRLQLTYVPGFLFTASLQEQAGIGNWSFLPELRLASGDIWLQPDRQTGSLLSGGFQAGRGWDYLALDLDCDLGYLSPDGQTDVLFFRLGKEISLRGHVYSVTEETRLLGSRRQDAAATDLAALLAERLAVEAGARNLRGRVSLQTFLAPGDGSASLLTGLEVLAGFPAASLALEAGGVLRRHSETWKIFPSARVLYAPAPGLAFRLQAMPFLGLPELPGFLVRNSFSPLPDWRPEAGYRIAGGVRSELRPGLEADLQAEYRWGSLYRPADPGWLLVPEQTTGTLTGRMLYRAGERLRFALLGGAPLPLPGEDLSPSPSTVKGGMEIDFNKPMFTFILELLWGDDPCTEPDPVLSVWGDYYSGTAVSLRTDWYIGARHILTQGLSYTMTTTLSGGELRYLLGYGMRRTKE